MKFIVPHLFGALCFLQYHGLAYEYVYPVSIGSAKGSVTNAEALVATNDTSVITLDGLGSEVVLDYGVNRGGFPTFWIESVKGDDVRLAVTYSEGHPNVFSYDGDGYLAYSNGANNNRTVEYELSSMDLRSPIKDYFLQGAQRWQRIYLTSNGSVTITTVGFESITDSTPIHELSGGFKSSDDGLTRVWEAGARTVQLVCNPIESIPPNWILQDDGALVPSQHASSNLQGSLWGNYTLTFRARATGTGLGWVMLTNNAAGVQLSINDTHASVWFGHSTTNNTTPQYSGLYTHLLRSAPLPAGFTGLDGSFHVFRTELLGDTVNVSVDNSTVLTYQGFLNRSGSFGSFGLGGQHGAAGVYTDLVVTDSTTGTVLYESNLKTSKALDDFKVATNRADVILDGARRDRLVWVGDIAVTTPSLFYSTAEGKYVRGSLELVTSWQNGTGAIASDVAPTAPYGESYEVKPNDFFYSLPYEIFGIQAYYDTFIYTANKTFIENYWENLKRQTARLVDLASNDGLVHITKDNSKLGMDWDWYDGPHYGAGTKLNSQACLAFQQMSTLAQYLNHTTLASEWATRATLIRDSINEKLWNSTSGFYMNSDEVAGIAQDANAWAIIAGVAAAANRSQTVLETLGTSLKTEFGFLAFSPDSGSRMNISPFTSAFHLEALLMTDAREEDVYHMLDHTFGTMADPSNANYTGTMWEVMFPDGTPGLDRYTSLSHGWGVGPTALLSRFVLGVQPVKPGFETWLIAPQPLNTTTAEGRVPTPYGTITVSWTKTDSDFTLSVESPEGTSGTVYLPIPASGEGVVKVAGEAVDGAEVLRDRAGRVGVKVGGGQKVTLVVA